MFAFKTSENEELYVKLTKKNITSRLLYVNKFY